MVKEKVQRIGIIGGVFNPVHNGHLRVALKVKKKLKLDRVIFIPSGKAPHREIKGATPDQRYEMVCLAIDGIEWIEVSDVEIKESKRTGSPVATVDTMRILKKEYNKDDKLFFIAGADEAETIELWKEPGRLLDMCSFVSVKRPGFKLDRLKKKYRQKMQVVDIAAFDISASNIRVRVEKEFLFKHLVPEPVADYIKKRGLYKD